MTKRARIRTTAAEIVDYWSRRETECGLSVDWADAHKRCWRCSGKRKLEKCHIVPDRLGGSDKPENLILLCHRCHLDQPNVVDPVATWNWLRNNAVSLYDTDWIIRGIDEFKRQFGRTPFSGLTADIPVERFQTELKKYRQMSIIHFGQGRPNPTTVCWILAQVEQAIIGRRSMDA
jgi:HNH endonuclease